jgi:hypothetical protein
MANTPVLTDEQWQEARRCAEIGMTLKEVAEDFGVEYEAVKKKAQRENWLTIFKLEKMLAETKEKEAKLSENTEKSPKVLDSSLSSSGSIEKRLLAFHTANKLGLARAAGKGIETALELMESGEIKPTSLQDLKTLADVAKIAWGGDAPSQAVQVNVLSSQPMEFSPHFDPVVETDKVHDV